MTKLRRSLIAMLAIASCQYANAQADGNNPNAASPAAAPNALAAYDPVTADSELMTAAVVQKSLFTDVVATDTGAIAVGERGHIMITSDFKTWTQVQAPTRSLLTKVRAFGANIWAVGHEEVILHSANGGQSWERKHADPDAFGPLLDILFLDDLRGMAVGVEGLILSTTDGGNTWERGNVSTGQTTAADAAPAATEPDNSETLIASDDMGEDETPPHLNAIVRNAAGLLAVGESGAMYTSIDDGKTWRKGKIPYKGSMFGAIRLSDDSIVAYGLNGNVYQTKDLGNSWLKLESGTEASIMGGFAAEGGRAVFVGARGSFLTKSADGSKLALFNYSDGGILGGVVQKSDSEFVVVGENGISIFDPTKQTQ